MFAEQDPCKPLFNLCAWLHFLDGNRHHAGARTRFHRVKGSLSSHVGDNSKNSPNQSRHHQTKAPNQTKTNQTKPKHETKLATIGLKVHSHPMSETIPRIHPIKVWPTMSATALGTRHKTSTDKCISYLLYYRGDSNLLLAGSLAEFEIISSSEWRYMEILGFCQITQ